MTKYKWPLNLQLFADGDEDGDGFDDTSTDDTDDFTDGDDFESSDEQAENTEQTETEDTTQTEDETEETTTETEPVTRKIRYNGEDKELSEEEYTALAQKGMNYEKAIERAAAESAQKARDSVIAEMGYEWNGKPITNEADYKAAVAEQQLMEQYKTLPPAVAERLVVLERAEGQRAQERQAGEAKAKQDQEHSDFLAAFHELHERPFDGSKDIVPASVWEAQRKGKALVDAYMAHHVKELRSQLKISKQNESNGKKAPVGSVTAGGGSKKAAADPFLSAFDEDN